MRYLLLCLAECLTDIALRLRQLAGESGDPQGLDEQARAEVAVWRRRQFTLIKR